MTIKSTITAFTVHILTVWCNCNQTVKQVREVREDVVMVPENRRFVRRRKLENSKREGESLHAKSLAQSCSNMLIPTSPFQCWVKTDGRWRNEDRWMSNGEMETMERKEEESRNQMNIREE